MLEKRICPKCGKEFEIDTSKSNRKFCSASCSNSHISLSRNKNISKTLKEKALKGESFGFIKPNNKINYCKICGKKIQNKKIKFCSNECKSINQFYKSLQKYFGLDISKLGTFDIFCEIDRIKNILYDLYWNKNFTSVEICKQFNYPNVGNLTGKIFKYLNIPSKSCKIKNLESVYYRKQQDINYNCFYKHGWHTTWYGKEVYLRSSYEFNYAKYLDEQKIKYDVECLRIKYFDSNLNEYRCAIPDFYLSETNTIIEIKSDWTLNIQNMKDKFNEYKNLGYKVKLILNNEEVDLYSL